MCEEGCGFVGMCRWNCSLFLWGKNVTVLYWVWKKERRQTVSQLLP